MNFIAQMQEQAAQAPKKIAFNEWQEEKILQACARLVELGIAWPVIIGKQAEVEARAAEVGVSTEGFSYIDNTDPAVMDKMVAEYLQISDMWSEKALRRKGKNGMNFAAMIVKCGWADCLASGFTCPTGDVVLCAQNFIGMEPGVNNASSLGIAEFPHWEGPQGAFLGLTDCAVQPHPDSEILSDIAIASATTVKTLLGWEPRVAMLSFSTKGSAEHEDVDVVRQAVELCHQKAPELLIDGEFQIDAAINPKVAAKKVKGDSPVAGKANVLVFPNLGAGNIGVKMTQIFGGAVAYGPVLQGFPKPVTDFSRSAPVDEIVGNLAMLVVRAQKMP